MKPPKNILANSFLSIILFAVIIFIAGSVAQLLAVSVFESTVDDELTLSGCFQASLLIFSILLIAILSKGKIGNYGFKIGRKVNYWKLIALVLLIDIVFIIPFFFIEIEGEGHFASRFTFLQEVVLVWILASVAEEIFTRGLILGFMNPLKKFGIKIGKVFISYPVIFCAMLFSMMHIPLLFQGIDQTLGIMILISTFSLGIIAGYYRELSGSLLPAIIAHSSANIIGSALPQITDKFL